MNRDLLERDVLGRAAMPRPLVVASTVLVLVSLSAVSAGKPPAAKPAATTSAVAAPSSPPDNPSATPTVAPGPDAPDDHARCKPSCYHTERPVKDFNKRVSGCGFYTKNIYQDPTPAGWGPSYMGQGVATLESVPSCKFPSSGGPKWATMEAWVRKNLADLEPGDAIVIPASESWDRSEGSDGSVSRALTFRWYTKHANFVFNECGVPGETTTCEADGSPSARAINVAHYRLDEAKKLKAAGNNAGCLQASLEAIATARGFAKDGADFDFTGDFKTRFDGTLTKKALAAKLAAIGKDAETSFKSCGGTTPTTTPDDEKAYYARW